MLGSPAAQQESPPRRRQTWVQGRKKAEEAERRKLRSHIEVLQDRARRFCENGPAPAAGLVNALLSQPVVDVVREQVDYGDMESAHEYADKLEELLPLIADDAYLRAVLTYELVGGDPDEPIKLSRVTDNAALRESLSLLYKIRADRLRHERLMAKLRGAYLPYSAGLIVIVLVLLALAILSGENPSDASSLAGWAQLVAVGAAGALGSVLAAAFKLRDTVQLDPLRGFAAITFIQPLIGASFGLMSWLILTSGLVKIGGANNQAWPTQVVVAFASGLSEPAFLNIVGRVIGPQR
jgi:hypothetical protein